MHLCLYSYMSSQFLQYKCQFYWESFLQNYSTKRSPPSPTPQNLDYKQTIIMRFLFLKYI